MSGPDAAAPSTSLAGHHSRRQPLAAVGSGPIGAQAGLARGDKAGLAHVLRRCSFGPRPGEVESFGALTPADLVEELLEDEGNNALSAADAAARYADDDLEPEEEWLRALLVQMMQGQHRLHERMTWLWHTHFTSSLDKASLAMMFQQHHRIRRNALGNFRTLATELTTDAAMLVWLDGDGSTGDAPNENYAREFLELFVLGRDQGYSEDDIRVAARVFSGWYVDWESGEVTFNEEAHYTRPLTFMGTRRRWDAESLIAHICGLPECHRHVARTLHRWFIGGDPADAFIDELAEVFADADLEIKPLVAAILRSDEFHAAHMTRVRQPVEWLCVTLQALGITDLEDAEIWPWTLEALGQMPFLPPNVAGWPDDDRWSSASQVVARASIVLDLELPESTHDRVAPTVDAVLARCGLYDVSETTRRALAHAESDFGEFDRRLELLFALALTSPEFALT